MGRIDLISTCSTWRPLIPKVEDRPLAFCDFRSVDPENLLPTERVYPHRVNESYYLTFNNNQKWHWISDQTPEELLVMVMYDTMSGNTARCK